MRSSFNLKFDFLPYLRLLRIDHWIKNLFLFPGVAIAVSFEKIPSGVGLNQNDLLRIILSFITLCIASSANYVINEWLDKEKDSRHPYKNHRIANHYSFESKNIYLLYFGLLAATLILMKFLNQNINIYLALLVIMGIFYNIQPFRTKDRAYLDVISESINNPIRLSIGWHAISENNPVPASAFISFWGVGIFLMSLKRYSEMKLINNDELLESYRKSFQIWTPEKLLVFSIVGVLASSTFAGILLARYRLEYILLFPFVVWIFATYLNKSLNLDPVSYAPEKLMKDKKLIFLSLALGALFVLLTFMDIKALYVFLDMGNP